MGRKGFQCREVSQPEAGALGPVTSRGCCAFERARLGPGPVVGDVEGQRSRLMAEQRRDGAQA